MGEMRLFRALKFWDNLLRQHLTKLDAPLVERINAPDGALGEDGVLVERHKLAERCWRELFGEDGIRRTVTLEHPVRHQPIRCALGLDFLGRLAKGQCLGLREDVRQEYVVVPTQWIERLAKGDKITRDEAGALMDQLVEGVLAIGARLTPVDGASLVVDRAAIECDVFAIALHGKLLQIRREALQVLLIWQDRYGLGAEEVVVPYTQEPQEHRQVALEGGSAEVLVHLVKTVEHGGEMLRADGQHSRQANGGGHGVAPTDPVPELEHVGGINPELRHFRGVRGDSDKMPGDGRFVAPETRE